jgi:hypothetical protein
MTTPKPPAGRICWRDVPAAAGIACTGYVGTAETAVFEIWRLLPSGREWGLFTHLPGVGEGGCYGTGPDDLKAEAERWLSEFVVSLGAVFPEDADREREEETADA